MNRAQVKATRQQFATAVVATLKHVWTKCGEILSPLWHWLRLALCISGVTIVIVAVSGAVGIAPTIGQKLTPEMTLHSLVIIILSYQVLIGLLAFYALRQRIVAIWEPISFLVTPNVLYWLFVNRLIGGDILFYLVILAGLTVSRIYVLWKPKGEAHETQVWDR